MVGWLVGVKDLGRLWASSATIDPGAGRYEYSWPPEQM